MIVFSLVLIFIIFGVYGWLSGIECGIGLLRLLPSSTLTRYSLRLFTPMWESANVFLLLGIAAFGAFFSVGFEDVKREVLPLALITIGLVIVRVGLVFLLFYTKAKTGLRFYNLLFAAVSFAVPLGLGAIGIRLLIGHNFWLTLGGSALFVSLAVGLLALAMAFVYYCVGQTPHGRIQALSLILNALFCIMVAIVLQQLVVTRQPHLLAIPFACFVILISFVVLWQAALWFSARDRYMWWYLSIVGIGSPALLALSNHPYLMFPNILVDHAYGVQEYGWLDAAGLAIVFPFLLVMFGWMTRLLLNRQRV